MSIDAPELASSTDGGYLIDPAARAAAYELKARYFYYVDTRQWDRLRALFTEDASFEGYTFGEDGLDSFMTGVEALLPEDVRSVHHGSMPMLRAESDTVIRARWSMRDYLTWEPGSRPFRGNDDPALAGFDGYGYYEEEYRRTEAGWKIQFMRLTRLRIDLIYGARPDDRFGAPAPQVEWLP